MNNNFGFKIIGVISHDKIIGMNNLKNVVDNYLCGE
jgi:hypothetical protein